MKLKWNSHCIHNSSSFWCFYNAESTTNGLPLTGEHLQEPVETDKWQRGSTDASSCQSSWFIFCFHNYVLKLINRVKKIYHVHLAQMFLDTISLLGPDACFASLYCPTVQSNLKKNCSIVLAAQNRCCNVALHTGRFFLKLMRTELW
jgi:hypothetical protein